MKLNFNRPLVTADGKTIGQQSIGRLLAAELQGAAIKDKAIIFKYWDWAKKLANDEMVDLDKGDQETIINAVVSSETMATVLKAQLLEVIEDAKTYFASKEKKAAGNGKAEKATVESVPAVDEE